MKVEVKVDLKRKNPLSPKTIYGELDLSMTCLAIGTPLQIGKKYFLYNKTPSDNISNCGYIQDGEMFIATATTPTVWTSSDIFIQNENITIYQNNVDVNIYVEVVTTNLAKLKITNGGFSALKTFPNIVEGSVVKVLDSNTIGFGNPSIVKYFKIEVLN